jgi:hypothetical protein
MDIGKGKGKDKFLDGRETLMPKWSMFFKNIGDYAACCLILIFIFVIILLLGG